MRIDEFDRPSTEDRFLARLRDTEDSFVERKTKLRDDELRETAVGFANTVHAPNTGVIFVGVGPNAEVLGIDGDPDKTQRKAAKAMEGCYPPIPHAIHAVRAPNGGPYVVAVEVSESADRPHFAGGAYVRRGSRTIKATEKVFQELVEDRLSMVRWLRPHIGKGIRVKRDRSLGRRGLGPGSSSMHLSDAILKDVNQFYVWIAEQRADGSLDAEETFALRRVTIEYDVKAKLPRLVILDY